MLALDDPRWGELQSNYGDGRQVAELLAQAAAGAPLEDWYDALFQELCHQYTTSEAAYAAAPHLVALAAEQPALRTHLLVLLGACYMSANAPGADTASLISETYRDEWQRAAADAVPLVAWTLTERVLPDEEVRYLLSTMAALHGYAALAFYIEGFDTVTECPNCGFLIEPSG